MKDETGCPVDIQPIPPIPAVGKSRSKTIWNSFRVRFRDELDAGHHLVRLQWFGASGELVASRSVRISIDLAAPRAAFIAPANHARVAPGAPIRLRFSDRGTSDMLLSPVLDLADIGRVRANALVQLQIERIEDLLDLDPASALIHGLDRPQILNMVSRARFIEAFSFNKKVFAPLLDEPLTRLALLTVEDLQHRVEIKPSSARRFISSLRILHTCFDYSIARKVALRRFLKRPPSRIDSVRLYVDGVDVSASAIVDKAGLEYIPGAGYADGEHAVRALIQDRAGNRREVFRYFRVDGSPPVVQIESPIQEAFYSGEHVLFRASMSDLDSGVDPESIVVRVDGRDLSAGLTKSADQAQMYLSDLTADGEYALYFSVADFAGNSIEREIRFRVDRTGPNITIEAPLDQSIVSTATVEVRGKIEDANLLEASIGSTRLELAEDGTFREMIALVPGANSIRIEARDRAGNIAASPGLTVIRTEPREAGYAARLRTQNGAAVAGAEIRELKSGRIALSDPDGRFHLTDLPEGRLLLAIRPPEGSGLAPLRLPVELRYGRLVSRSEAITLLSPLDARRMQRSEEEGRTVIRNPAAPELQLSYPAGTALAFPGEGPSAIAIEMLDTDQLPYELPDFVPPGRVARLEPAGLRVENGESLALMLPNDLGGEPGQTLPLVMTCSPNRVQTKCGKSAAIRSCEPVQIPQVLDSRETYAVAQYCIRLSSLRSSVALRANL